MDKPKQERWAEKKDFIVPYISFEYILDIYFWSNLEMSSHLIPSPVDLWLTYKISASCFYSFFYSFLRYWAFRNPAHSDRSRPFLEITLDLEFCQIWKVGWEVKYHDNFPSRLFSASEMKQFSITKYNMTYAWLFSPKYKQNRIFFVALCYWKILQVHWTFFFVY